MKSLNQNIYKFQSHYQQYMVNVLDMVIEVPSQDGARELEAGSQWETCQIVDVQPSCN